MTFDATTDVWFAVERREGLQHLANNAISSVNPPTIIFTTSFYTFL